MKSFSPGKKKNGAALNRAFKFFITNSHYLCIDSIPQFTSINLYQAGLFFIDHCRFARAFEKSAARKSLAMQPWRSDWLSITLAATGGEKKKRENDKRNPRRMQRSAAGAAKSVPYSLSFPPFWRKIFSPVEIVRSQIKFAGTNFYGQSGKYPLPVVFFFQMFLHRVSHAAVSFRCVIVAARLLNKT